MNTFFTIFLSSLLFLGIGLNPVNYTMSTKTTSAKQDNDWSLVKEKNNIKIYTRSVENYVLKEFKGTTTVDKPLAEVLSILTNPDEFGKWMAHFTTSTVIKKITDNEYYHYTVADAPWPISDRDNIALIKITRNETNEVTMHIKSVPDFIPHKKGLVRVPESTGYWKLIPNGDNSTTVVHQALARPGGAIPDWLANLGVVKIPFDTLSSLRKWFEQ